MSHLVSHLSLRWIRQLTAVSLVMAAFSASAQTVSAPLNVTTFAGAAGERQAINGAALAARFFEPSGLVFDSSGNLYIADSCNNLFRKLDTNGTVSTFAGTPMDTADHRINLGSADGTGPAASFFMGQVTSGGLWTAPVPGVDPNVGAITLGIDSQNNIYFADTQNDTIRMITPAGTVSTIAGAVGAGNNNDGVGSDARFNVPCGVTAAADGTVYVADTGNHAIRKLTFSGGVYTVTTLAGGSPGILNGTGTAAQFKNPSGIVVDSSGTLYVTDTANHAIRKVTAAGVVSTLAGTLGVKGTSDGTGTQARFNGPTGIALDGNGNLYVVDTGNNAIRLVTAAGTVTTVAGLKGTPGATDGIGTAARFSNPYGITIHGATVYIGDSGNQTIRQGVASTTSGSLQVTSVPPSIIKARTGDALTLKIVATGTPSPTYQWSKNGIAIAGATSSTLAINSVSGADAAAYSVVATSDQVTFSSSPTTLQVYSAQDVVPVAIVSEPAAHSVAVGQSTSFAVEASGTNLAYQWAKNGTAIVGATTATYSISSAQASDAANYTVTVTSAGFDAATSDAATLTVTGVTNVAPAFITQPISQSAVAGATVVLTAAASGTPTPTFKWQKDGLDLANGGSISGATTASLTITGVSNADVGTYKAVATNVVGSTLSNAATITIGAPVAPSFTTQPSSQTASAGTNVTFTVAASGSPTPTIQWQKNGTAISGATSTTLTLNNVSSADAATYTAVATNVGGTATSNGATLTVGSASDPGRIINMSVLTSVGAGEDFTFGYVLGGSGTSGNKPILMRAIGPSLVPYNVSPVLPNPYLEFYNGSTQAGTNEDWGGDATIRTVSSAVGAFPFVSNTSKDAALYVTNVPSTGLHSVKVFSHDNGSGGVIAEVYDATSSSTWTTTTPRLINVSVQKNVGTLTTVGFSITGSTAVKVLIRAVGPGLAPFGVGGLMDDPKLAVYVLGASTPFDTNDNWGGTAQLTAATNASGAFGIPANSKDAVLLETLQPGQYTAQVSPSTGATGVAIIEVYEVPQ